VQNKDKIENLYFVQPYTDFLLVLTDMIHKKMNDYIEKIIYTYIFASNKKRYFLMINLLMILL